MPAQCTTKPLEVEPHGRRRVVADFDGGPITSDAGTLLLRRVDWHLSVSDQVAACFADMIRPGCYQPEQQLLDGFCTRWKKAPFHGALRFAG